MRQQGFTARLRELNDAAAAAASEHGMQSPESRLAAEDALTFAMETTVEPEAEAGG